MVLITRITERFTPSMEMPFAANGINPLWEGDAKSAYPEELTKAEAKENPLAVLKVKTPPKEPVTVNDHVTWLVIRATGLAHWTKQNRAESEPVILEMLARMEGTIQSLRTMIKSGPDKDQDKFDAFLSHLGE